MKMSSEVTIIVKFWIYADFESLPEKKDDWESNPEKSYIMKIN